MNIPSIDIPDRVLLFGGRGHMARHFLSWFPQAVTSDADIANPAEVSRALDLHRPEVVINCAGKTGRPNVDWCETHQTETYRANVTGALVVLDKCLRRQVYLVHLSSGCIYEGDNGGKGFSETDAPNYTGSFYSRTKALSDQALAGFPVLTLRLRMPFDGSTSERNLLTKLRRYRRVLDVPNSLTHLPDFFRAAKELIARRATGVFNIVNEGAMSPCQVMERYRELVDPGHDFEPLPLSQLPEVASAGRSNCLLNIDKLRAAGIDMPPVGEAVDEALRSLAGQLKEQPCLSLTGSGV